LAEDDRGGSLRTTPPTALAVAALFGVLGAWLVVVVANSLDLVPPQVPWTAPAAIGLIAALVGALAYHTHQRIQVRRERMDPQRAVTLLVLGKSSALAGALVAGGYLAYGVTFLARWEADAPRDRVIRAALALVAGIGLCIAGLLLERACKVPGGDDEEETPPDDVAAAA